MRARDPAAKTAVIYARVSSKRQADEELPIESQIEQCKARAAALGARVERVFTDNGISGRYDDRQAFQDAITYCELSSPSYLVTWSTSRFARNKVDAGMYKLRLAKAGTEIVYVSLNIDRKSDSGWMTESVLELFDEFYSRQISADTIRSQVKNARDGYYNGGTPPFGYESRPAPENPKRRRLFVVESEAHVVQDIFRLRADGQGARSIAMVMNTKGLLNRSKRWTKSSILALLRNQAVIGQIVFGRRDRETRRLKLRDQWIVVDSHEPIISVPLWESVQSMMDEASSSDNQGSPKSTYLFTGILYCEESGSSMQIESAKGRSKRYWYYNCRDYQKKGEGRPRRISAREFDAWLVEVIMDRILTKELLTEVVADLQDACGSWATDHRKRRLSVATALKKATGKNEKIYELFELLGKDTPNLGDLTRRLRKNNEEIKTLESKLASIEAEDPPEVTVSDAQIAEISEALRYIVRTTDNPKKLRHFFSSFIDRIWVGDDSVRIEYRPECLIYNREPIAVPSKDDWLPEHALLRTRILAVRMPGRFHRKAA